MAYQPSNQNGQATMANSSPVVIASDQSALTATLVPGTTNGLNTYHLVSTSNTNATNIKNAPGIVYGWYIFNNNASARKLAFHNTAGTPTAGSGILFSLVIPALSGANVSFYPGITFSTGIGITTVTGIPDTDTTGVALNDLTINIFWK